MMPMRVQICGADLRQFVQDVARDEDGLAHVFEFFEEFTYFDACARVETARRLVQKQQLRVVQKHAGQSQPLLHPAREGIHRRVPLLREVRQ